MRSLTYSLAVLLSLSVVAPCLAASNAYLIFRMDKKTRTLSDRPSAVWYSDEAPVPGKNIHGESTVIQMPKELRGKRIQHIKREGLNVKFEPPVEPARVLTPEQLAKREIEQTLKSAATDDTITDEKYARLLRISNIEDSAKRKAEWDKIKDEVKKQ